MAATNEIEINALIGITDWVIAGKNSKSRVNTFNSIKTSVHSSLFETSSLI